MDVRMWSKDLITDFINSYKSYPCLWKVKSRGYKNRNLRDIAYRNMTEFCKMRGFPDATRDFVVKKIQSLRGSFRKEIKKFHESQCGEGGTEDVYTPSLWYFELLTFTIDQDFQTDSVSNMDESETQGAIGEIEEYEMEEANMLKIKHENARKYFVTQTPKPAVNTVNTVNLKRKIADCQEPETCIEYCSPTPPISNSQSLNDFDAVGLNVSKKLTKMEPIQAVYAESLINGIIRRGMLNKLMDETDFCDGSCK